jgi:hypothetical protein
MINLKENEENNAVRTSLERQHTSHHKLSSNQSIHVLPPTSQQPLSSSTSSSHHQSQSKSPSSFPVPIYQQQQQQQHTLPPTPVSSSSSSPNSVKSTTTKSMNQSSSQNDSTSSSSSSSLQIMATTVAELLNNLNNNNSHHSQKNTNKVQIAPENSESNDSTTSISSIYSCTTNTNEQHPPTTQQSQNNETTTTNEPTKYSKIEMLLNQNSQQILSHKASINRNSLFSMHRKKSSMLHRKTIRNYTSNLNKISVMGDLSSNLGSGQFNSSSNSSSLLLLQPVNNQVTSIPCTILSQNHQRQQSKTSEYDMDEAKIHQKSMSIFNPYHQHYYQTTQSLQQQVTTSVEDETANLRLLVEVAVGLWEEQNRNFEYRN